MNSRWLLIVSLLVVAAMVAFAFHTNSIVPEGTQLPTRFDANGEARKYTDVLPALLIMPVITLFSSLLFSAVPRIEPLQDRLEGSAPLLRVAWLGLLVLMPLTQVAIAAPAYGWELPPLIVLSGVGVLLVVMGNWLPKSRPGFFVGIRTPWTITDTDIWVATHRLGGKLMIAAGLIWIVAPFLPLPGPGEVRSLLIGGAIIVSVIVPVVYSFMLWRRKKTDPASSKGS